MIASTAVTNAPSILAQSASFQASGPVAAVEEHGAQLSRQNKGIFDLRDTFWHIEELHGVTATYSGVIVNIELLRRDEEAGIITFTTPSYSIGFSFVHRPSGLEFSPTSAHSGSVENERMFQDQQTAKSFESELLKTCSYEIQGGILTFRDKDQHSTIVLSSVRQNGIENRRWQIATYRGDGNNSTQKDELIDTWEQADIVFMNKRVYGSPGCGGWVGTYAVSGDNLTSDVGTILAGLCSSKQFAQAYLVEKALKGERRIEKEGSNVLLRDNSGRAMLLLVPFSPR